MHCSWRRLQLSQVKNYKIVPRIFRVKIIFHSTNNIVTKWWLYIGQSIVSTPFELIGMVAIWHRGHVCQMTARYMQLSSRYYLHPMCPHMTVFKVLTLPEQEFHLGLLKMLASLLWQLFVYKVWHRNTIQFAISNLHFHCIQPLCPTFLDKEIQGTDRSFFPTFVNGF